MAKKRSKAPGPSQSGVLTVRTVSRVRAWSRGGELRGLVVGEDAAAGRSREEFEGGAGGGELNALGGLARSDFEGGLGG